MTVDVHHNFMIGGNIIVKNCDGLRYGLIFRTLSAEHEAVKEEDEFGLEDYEENMTGGEATASYISF